MILKFYVVRDIRKEQAHKNTYWKHQIPQNFSKEVHFRKPDIDRTFFSLYF
jgi:hypothetical protein